MNKTIEINGVTYDSSMVKSLVEERNTLRAVLNRFHLHPPEINIKCEIVEDGIIGSTYLEVLRVETEDDGSFTVVTNHWPIINK